MNATAAAGAAILEKLKELLGDRFNEVLELPLTEVPNEILEYIRNNPGQTAFYVANGAIFFCPALLTGPLLNALGFTFIGPRFAAIASTVQRTFGTTWLFRVLHSAGMNGWGAPIVANAARSAAVFGGVAGAAWERVANSTRAYL